MSSAYSQAEYLATSTRQVEIPPTTPEHYITGIYALNLAAPEGTSGDWHDVFHWQNGTEQPLKQATMLEPSFHPAAQEELRRWIADEASALRIVYGQSCAHRAARKQIILQHG